ncbi:MAG TPA: hypothetical protein VJ783_03130 [Pirellulales bacterium]|nr:hypothetical protein [Pirellulales bacterium]
MKRLFLTAVGLLAVVCAGEGCAMLNRPTGEGELSPDSAVANPQSSPAAAPKGGQQAPPPQWLAGPPTGNLPRDAAARPSGIGTAASKATGGAVGANAKPGTAANADSQALADVLAELAAMGALEPESQQRLIDDLRATDPGLWPGVVQTFRASLAYRRRAADRAKAAAPSQDQPAEFARNDIATISTLESSESTSVGGPPPAAVSALPNASDATTASLSPTAGNVASAPAAASSLPVQPASHQTPAPASPAKAVWQQQLAPAIVELEKQTRESPQDADAVARHVWLRMLYLAAGRRDDALKPIPGIAPAQQDYWSKQLFALATYLDSQRTDDSSLRAAEAVQHLTRAAASLAEQGRLRVCNLAFCSAVESYGVHKRIEQHEFKPDQELLVYAEVENFKSEETEQGFHTALQSSYQILDSQGRRVAHDELPLTEEVCGNRRRDYFVRYFVRLPKTIYDGAYTLEWTIEDTLARKIGQSTIEFTIKQKK